MKISKIQINQELLEKEIVTDIWRILSTHNPYIYAIFFCKKCGRPFTTFRKKGFILCKDCGKL